MDIRIMEYYLAVIREGNISAAAEALHVSQPALSRQIKDLEKELGVTLFERGSRRIKLTEEGMILRRRAEEMVRLMQMTESEISRAQKKLSGEIHIGAGESLAFHVLSRIAGAIHGEYPEVRFTVTSGDTEDLMEQLENGLVDVALIFTGYDHSQYQGGPPAGAGPTGRFDAAGLRPCRQGAGFPGGPDRSAADHSPGGDGTLELRPCL